MTSSSIRVLVLTLIISVGLCSCTGRMNVSEKMMWSTYPLATQKGEATGFVINHRVAGVPGGVVPVLFTSVHVLDTVKEGPLIIGCRILNEAGEAQVALLAFAPPKLNGKERFYVRHPKHDIAAVALQLPAEITSRGVMSSFLHLRNMPRDGRYLRNGMEVAFLGYPEVLPGTEGAFPVLRSGKVASYPVGTSQAHGRFLINSDVYPGDSGAPVFSTGCGSRPKLVGMVIERVGVEKRDFSHLAVAVDADVIRETLALITAAEAPPDPSQLIDPHRP